MGELVFGPLFFSVLVYGGLALAVLGVVGVAVLFVRDARAGRLW